MTSQKIIFLSPSDKELLSQTEKLFDELYSYINNVEKELMLAPEKNAASLWLEGIKKTLGRFGQLVVAVENNKVLGFGYGLLRFTPDHLGEKKVGYITYFYVSPSTQKKGSGKKILQQLEHWFKEKKVHSIELQVTFNNTAGQAFWKAMGYKNEVIQLRKIV